MGVDHYENFPVASVLIPARLRPAVRAIYRFARTADDIADEGQAVAAQRLAQLDALEGELDAIDADRASPAWTDLAAAVRDHRLDTDQMRALLSAFRQDVTTTRYADAAALLDYCRRSANPVGRLMLQLFGRDQEPLRGWSDAICTGLQLVNFWQDVAIDWAKGRVYLPQDALAAHGVDEAQIAAGRCDRRWSALMRTRTAHAAALLHHGRPLGRALGGRIGAEIRLIVEGGLRIAERIDAAHGDVFRHRPQLGPADWCAMAVRALRH